jgi:hypothetical protein
VIADLQQGYGLADRGHDVSGTTPQAFERHRERFKSMCRTVPETGLLFGRAQFRRMRYWRRG